VTRFLAFADIHLGSGASYEREPGDRLRDQADVLEQITQLARHHQVDAILNAGDVFEGPTVTPEQEEVFADFLRDCRAHNIPVISVCGNGRHDLAMRNRHALTVFKYFESHFVLDRPQVQLVRGVNICALPWSPVSRLVAASNGGDRDTIHEDAAEHLLNIARGLRAECDGPAILLAHWSVEGASLPTGLPVETLREPVLPRRDLQEIGFDAIVLGHIHRGQVNAAYEPPLFYCGSPLPLSFGEERDWHGCWLLDVGGGTAFAELLPLKSRAFITHDLDLTTNEGVFALGDLPPVGDAIVRVRIKASETQARDLNHAEMRDALYSEGAYKVMPLEVTIVREQRARVEGVDEQVAPLEAVAMWCDANSIDSDRAAGLLDLAGAWL
jgi:exonuclease SbcD